MQATEEAARGWRAAIAEPLRDIAGESIALSDISVTGAGDFLPSSLGVMDCAVASVAVALLAASQLAFVNTGSCPPVELAFEHVAAAFRSEAHLRSRGQPVGRGFAPLSRFWPAADGFIRTHANYPWHREALERALGAQIGEAALAVQIAGALADLEAVDAETRIVAAGGAAAAVRTADEWRDSPQGRAAGIRQLVEIEAIGAAPPRRIVGSRGSAPVSPHRPATGLRVLDLTRVIAGPVTTRMLAALGADVLRLDPPALPELALHRVDGLHGKRSAVLDATDPAGRRIFDALVEGADVIVCGYRPFSLGRFGLHPGALAARHPGVVVAYISAWGTTGPWGSRRGFDSLVQAASGIALLESSPRAGSDAGFVEGPGALPCQALDHASGYLAAAGILAALARQRSEGGTLGVWVCLARTAQWLLGRPASTGLGTPALEVRPWLVGLADGVTAVAPPGVLGGHQLSWPVGRGRYGADTPTW